MLRVHSAKKGKISFDYPSSARLAAKAATARAKAGASVTVTDGSKVVMVCHHKAKGRRRTASCRIEPAFKKRIKAGR